MALDYREDDWPIGQTCPYQIRLDNGRKIYAPADVDQVIRKERTFEIQRLLESRDEVGLRQKCLPLAELQFRSAEDRRAQLLRLNEPNRKGEPPVVCLFRNEKNIEWILKAATILESGGTDMGVTDDQQSSVLHYAAARGSPELLDYCFKLLEQAEEYDLDINAADTEGSEYTSGQWVVLEEDKRYMTEAEKRVLDAQASTVRAQNNTVSRTLFDTWAIVIAAVTGAGCAAPARSNQERTHADCSEVTGCAWHRREHGRRSRGHTPDICPGGRDDARC